MRVGLINFCGTSIYRGTCHIIRILPFVGILRGSKVGLVARIFARIYAECIWMCNDVSSLVRDRDRGMFFFVLLGELYRYNYLLEACCQPNLTTPFHGVYMNGDGTFDP